MKTIILFFFITIFLSSFSFSSLTKPKKAREKVQLKQTVDSAGISGIKKEKNAFRFIWNNEQNTHNSQETYMTDSMKSGC